MFYSADLGAFNAIFAVPTVIVDRHIKLAGAAQLKVLLCLLRRAGEDVSVESLAETVGLSRADTADALQYWVESGILHAGETSEAESKTPPDPALSEEPEKHPADPPAAAPPLLRIATPSPKPNSDEVARRACESGEISFLLQEAQLRLGRLISPGEAATLVWLHDYNGLPTAVILMIMEFAGSEGKANMRYIEKVAINWANEEIDTLEKAEQKLSEIHTFQSHWGKLMTALSLDRRNPSPREKELVTRWMTEWKLPVDLIRAAYDECVDHTGKLSFAYMNKVLERWHAEGVKNPGEARALPQKRAASPASAKGGRRPSYDLDTYERMTNTVPQFKRKEG